jgi:hypothetical protein
LAGHRRLAALKPLVEFAQLEVATRNIWSRGLDQPALKLSPAGAIQRGFFASGMHRASCPSNAPPPPRGRPSGGGRRRHGCLLRARAVALQPVAVVGLDGALHQPAAALDATTHVPKEARRIGLSHAVAILANGGASAWLIGLKNRQRNRTANESGANLLIFSLTVSGDGDPSRSPGPSD